LTAPNQSPLPPQTARERIEARRAARRKQEGQPKPKRFPYVWVIVGVVALVLVSGLFWAISRAFSTIQSVQQEDPRPRATPQVAIVNGTPVTDNTPPPVSASLGQPLNILLIGVDKRPINDDGVRSDTLIVVHLDPQERWASMLSIPRDSVVNVPHLGTSKINAAFSYGYTYAEDIYGRGTDPDAGGGALAAQAVEEFLGVPIDYVAQVDFNGFEQIVNAIGGVMLDIERPLLDSEYPTDNFGVERVYIPAGLQVLDGRHALIYARSRHSSNDFDRSRRQQQVLKALLNQVRERGVLENAAALPAWTDVLAKNVRTTLPLTDLTMLNSLANFAQNLSGDRIVQLSINPNDVAVDFEDGSDIYWNAQDVQNQVKRWLAGPNAANIENSKVQVLNGAAVQGIAGQVSQYLTAQGFDVLTPSNAPYVFEQTMIFDYGDHPQTRQRLANLMGLSPNAIQAPAGDDAPWVEDGVDVVVVVGTDYKQEWLTP
jgi:LCP family protein required for cell wall assembly